VRWLNGVQNLGMKITDLALKAIETHAAESYPRECFGFLLGKSPVDHWIRQSVRGKNIHPRPKNHFEMDATDFAKTAHFAENQGLDVIGVYHSHPDAPAEPSQSDLAMAVEGWLYVIVSVREGKPIDTQCRQIAPDAPRRFTFVPIEIIDESEFQHDR